MKKNCTNIIIIIMPDLIKVRCYYWKTCNLSLIIKKGIVFFVNYQRGINYG
jgi:hypothetical protein